MITSPILEDKWRVQKALSEQADNDPGKYIALAHKRAGEAQERFGIRLRYIEEPLPGERAESPDEPPEHSLAAHGNLRGR
jgi:hypothetical protein